MASYRTGRSRRLVLSGTISGEIYRGSGSAPAATKNVSVLIYAGWVTAGARPSVAASNDNTGWTCTATDGLGGTQTQTVADTSYSEAVDGSYSLEADVEEWVTFSDLAVFPSYGGSEVEGDLPHEASCVFDERLKIDGTVKATITYAGQTATAETTITSATVVQSYACGLFFDASSYSLAQDATLTFTHLGMELPSYTKASGGVTLTAGASQMRIETTASAGQSGSYDCFITPPIEFSLSGKLFSDIDAFTQGGTVRVRRKNGEDYVEVEPSAGSYSCTYKQEQYNLIGTINGVAQDAETKSELYPQLYHYLVPPTGEAANEWRLLLRGPAYLAGTIAQAATVAVDGGFSFGDSGTGRTFSPAKSFAGYRYLCVDTDQVGKTVTLTIGLKVWTAITDADGIATFDLCGPSNIGVDHDGRNSRWPIPTDVNTLMGDGVMWGVANVSAYSLAAETGVTCAVAADKVYLSRTNHATVDCLHNHLYWVEQQDASDNWLRPFLRGDTDGKRSLEECDYKKLSAGAGTYVYAVQTIETIFEEINATDTSVVRNPGWSAVLEAAIDVADGSAGETWMSGDWALCNQNRPATWLMGGGALYREGAWTVGLDLDASSAYSLYAQMLCDKVTVYPGAGDVFGHATGASQWLYGTNDTPETGVIELRGARFLRSAAWGLVFSETGEALHDVNVTQKYLPELGDAGSGTTDTRGEYRTGTPYARGGVSHRVQATGADDSASYLDRTVYTGGRMRACFTSVPGQWLSYDVSASMRHARAFTYNGSICVGATDDVHGQVWIDRVLPHLGDHPCVRWWNTHPAMPLMVDYDYDGTVYRTWSDYRGNEVGDVVTLADGAYPTLCITSDGRQFHYWRDAGAIKGVCLSSTGGTAIPTFTAVASGVDESAIAAKDYAVRGNLWQMNLMYRSSGSIVVKSSTDGVNFT